MSNHAFSSKVYNRQKFTIPKNSVYQIQFNGNNPNYYRVNNLGETVLYFATSNTPREDLYDFKCSPNSVANFAEPYTRDFLYCYNPNNVDVDILITYWEGEFDPAFIAFGESTLSVEGTVKTDGVINAFNAPLPSGNNVIGLVGLSETATRRIIDIYNKTSNISTSTNGIKTNTETIKTDLSDINTNTGELLGIKTDTAKLDGIGTNLSIVLASTNTTRGYVDEIRAKLDTANEYLKGIYEKTVWGILNTLTYQERNIYSTGDYYMGQNIVIDDRIKHSAKSLNIVLKTNGDNLNNVYILIGTENGVEDKTLLNGNKNWIFDFNGDNISYIQTMSENPEFTTDTLVDFELQFTFYAG